MNSAILVTKYHENCADCPCCNWGEYSFSCQAHDDSEICDKKEYYSHRKYNMTLGTFEGEYKAPRPDWCQELWKKVMKDL